MRRNVTQPGTMRMLEALLEMGRPLDLTSGNNQAQREAKLLDEKEQETRWYDEKRLGRGRVWQRKNGKRKGNVRNNVESAYIKRIS